MAFIIFYITLFFLIITIISWSAFNYWNPDISMLVKSERIKKFLYDRYWFIHNKKELKSKNLFLVFSNNLSECFKELGNELENPELHNFFADTKKAFELLNINGSVFLFFNPCLLNSSDELQEMRLNLHLRNLLKLRCDLGIDGFIYFPNQNAFAKNPNSYKELSEEATQYAKIFKYATKKLQAKIPLFFIDNSRVKDIPPFHLFPLISEQNDNPTIFSFYHKTLENTDDLHNEIKIALEVCVENYEKHAQHYLLTLEQSLQLKVVTFFYNLKSNLIAFSKNYNDYFYKNISLKEKHFTNSNYIINLSGFYKKDAFEDSNSNLMNMFKYISIHLANGAVITDQYIKNKIRKRYLLVAFTLINFTFVSFSLISSNSFLIEKRNVFIQSFTQLKTFISNYNKIINEPNHTNKLQQNICQLINNSTKLASTDFEYSLLYPSWNSNIGEYFTEKYNYQLANFISKIMIQNFNDKVSSQFHSFNTTQSTQFTNHEEYLRVITNFVADNNKINEIYSYLDLPNKNNAKALTLMASYLYGLDCGKTLAEKNVFSALNNIDLSRYIKINYNDFKANTIDNLKNNLSSYFIFASQINPLYKTLNQVDSDIIFIKNGSHTNTRFDELQFLQKFVFDLNELQDNLLKSQIALKDTTSFYGPVFLTLLAEIEKNPILGKTFSTQVTIDASRSFEKFKTDLLLFIPAGANFPIVTNNGGLFILNSTLSQLAMGLSKMESTFNQAENQQLNKNETHSDLKLLSLNLPQNAFWDIEAIQSQLQKGSIFAAAVAGVNQNSLPECLALYFQNISKTLSFQYWNTKLASSVKVFSAAADQDPSIFSQQIDPNIQNIQLSGPILKSISELLLASNNSELNLYLSSIVNQQIIRQAKIYSRILELSPFFNPNPADFMNWTGDSSPAFLGYGVGSEDDLKMYLFTQKGNLENFFNRNIFPLLQTRSLFFKAGSGVYDKSLENLLSLQDGLSATPKVNTFASFSNFITSTVSNLRTESCNKFLTQPPISGSNDYFSLKQKEIYNALAKRCQSLLIKQAYNSYDKIAFKFNNLLANKFPFTNNSNTLDSVSIDDMASFFQSFSDFQKQDLPTLKNYSNLYKGRTDIQNFVQKMLAAQAFFNILIDKDGNIIPTKWNVDFTFRTNTDKEVLANQIISWSIQSGEQTIGSDQGSINKAKFIWNYSDPLQFYVTLANTSKYSLEKFSQNKDIFITNNTIYFNIRNRWSILKFVNDYADCPNINYCLKNTLKFELPINGDKKVVFFVSLNIKNFKGIRMNIPKLPSDAPYFDKKNSRLEENG